MPQSIKESIKDRPAISKSKSVTIPSWYSEGWESEFEKDRGIISHDNSAVELQKSVKRVITANRKDLEKLNNAQSAIHKDPTSTPDAAAAKTLEFSEEVSTRIYDRSAPLEAKIHEYSQKIQDRIDSEIRAAVSESRDPSRVQDYLLNLEDKSARLAFLRNAILTKSLKTVAPVLTDHGFLSGLDDEDITKIKKDFINAYYPQQVETMNYLSKLAEIVGRGYLSTIENLRALDTPAARRAISLRDQAKKARTFDD